MLFFEILRKALLYEDENKNVLQNFFTTPLYCFPMMTCDLPDENVVVKSVLMSITREKVDRVINVMGYMAKQIWDLQICKEKTINRINS